MISLAAAILFTIGLVWFILLPQFADRNAAMEDQGSEGPDRSLLDQRDRCLQVLSDLDLDLATQKISESEYQAMKKQTDAELAALLRQIEEDKQAAGGAR